MRVQVYDIVLLSFVLGCVSASRVRLVDHKDSDEESSSEVRQLFIPGVVRPGSVIRQPVDVAKPPATGRFAVPPGAPMGVPGNMPGVPNGEVAQEMGAAFPDAIGMEWLEACGAWLSATSPTTGLIFLIVFINEEMRERALEMQEEECIAMLDGFSAQPGDFSAVDKDFMNAVKKGASIDAWTQQHSDWVAFVAKDDSIKAVFSGDKTGIISKNEATERDPVTGAVSWGFSMLLHRLKLQGITKATITSGTYNPPLGADNDLLYFDLFRAKAALQALQDVQEAGSIDAWIFAVETEKAQLELGAESDDCKVDDDGNLQRGDGMWLCFMPVEERQAQIGKLNHDLLVVDNLDDSEIEGEIERLEKEVRRISKEIRDIPKDGARVDHPTMKPNNPYTYESVRVVKKGVIDHHGFDLSSEDYGSQYGEDEPY